MKTAVSIAVLADGRLAVMEEVKVRMLMIGVYLVAVILSVLSVCFFAFPICYCLSKVELERIEQECKDFQTRQELNMRKKQKAECMHCCSCGEGDKANGRDRCSLLRKLDDVSSSCDDDM